MSATTVKPPLAGVRVLDWTHVLAGPQAAFQLAALGAEVVRLESPRTQDLVRHKSMDAERAALGLGDGYCMLGAGRRTVCADATTPLGQEAVAALVASADVVLENFRPGKLDAMGFAPERLIAQQPQLIVCSITGYPSESERSSWPAYDHVIQAASGLMVANADASGRPQRVGFPLIDYAVGMHAAQAVLAALLRRAAQTEPRTQGEWLKVSMLETANLLMTPVFAAQAISGQAAPRSAATAFSGSALSGTFDAADAPLALVCNNAAQSKKLLGALAQAGIATEQLTSLAAAAQTQDVVSAQAVLQRVFAQRDADFWERTLAATDVPCSRVRTPFEAFEACARPLQIDVGLGEATQPVSIASTGFRSNLPLHGALAKPAPRGWHTDEVLRELGWADAQLRAAHAAGALEQHAARASSA